jgi:hypothetical protein
MMNPDEHWLHEPDNEDSGAGMQGVCRQFMSIGPPDRYRSSFFSVQSSDHGVFIVIQYKN